MKAADSLFTSILHSGKITRSKVLIIGKRGPNMTKKQKKERSDLLYESILTLQDLDECRKFFEDLCTVAELRAMEQRFEVALLLSDGMIYNDILERTGASSATISRVNRSLNYGADGYKNVLPRAKDIRKKYEQDE